MGIRALPQHLTITGALALSLCLLALLAAGSGQAHAAAGDYITGQVIVKVESEAALHEHILQNDKYAGVDRLDDDELPDNLATQNIYLLRTPDNYGVEEFVVDLLAGSPANGVVYAEPNYIAEAPEVLGDARMKARSPGYNKQPTEGNEGNTTYGDEANLNLSCSRGDIKGAIVAVLDTGAQLSHPALQGNFRKIKRYDFVDNDTTPSDEKFYRNADGDRVRGELAGHGTHVTGIVDQVAPGAKIMPLRVLDPRGLGDAYTVARAIYYAWWRSPHDVDVINLSLGTSKHSELLEEMVANATGDGIIVTAAAGNSGADAPHYPAAGAYDDGTGYPALFDPTKDGLVAVTSLREDRVKSNFANYGIWVDIAAQGENIRSTYLGDRYATWSGTSMATPFISGQAALISAVSSGQITSGNIELKIREKADATIYTVNETKYLLPNKQLGAGQANVCGSIGRGSVEP